MYSFFVPSGVILLLFVLPNSNREEILELLLTAVMGFIVSTSSSESSELESSLSLFSKLSVLEFCFTTSLSCLAFTFLKFISIYYINNLIIYFYLMLYHLFLGSIQEQNKVNQRVVLSLYGIFP